jgi:6-phospho-beta-glucosidase
MARRIKLAYIGGGSLFVPAVINGISKFIKDSNSQYEVELVLFDISQERQEKMKDYGKLVAEYNKIPLFLSTVRTRKEAIEGADIVFISVSLQEEIKRLNDLVSSIGLTSWHPDGLGVIGEALALAPFHYDIAKEIKMLAPNSWIFTLVNPTDILSGFMKKVFGVMCVGLCVEVDGLRGALGYYFNISPDDISIYHAGVNHDGWVLDIKVGEQSVYNQWRERFSEILKDPNFHPGNYTIAVISELTGYIKSSGYHNWPYRITSMVHSEDTWKKWRNKRNRCLEALERSLVERKPIIDPEHIHPEASLLYYPLTGESIGKLVKSRALNTNEIISLQIENDGSISNFPNECIVEVPVLVNASTLKGIAMGELPEWLGGYTKLLAIQRSMTIEYLIEPELKKLKQALSVLPMVEETEKLITFANILHKTYARELEALKF